MDLIIGSKLICNTSGILNVQGERQVSLEWGEWSGQLLLTMNLYDASRRHIARLRRNEWTFNDNGQFELARNPRGLKLIDTRTGQVALEARVVGQDKVEIGQGTSHSHTGDQVEIAAECWRIAGSTLSATKTSNNCTGRDVEPEEG
jgi:hypothetical protein